MVLCTVFEHIFSRLTYSTLQFETYSAMAFEFICLQETCLKAEASSIIFIKEITQQLIVTIRDVWASFTNLLYSGRSIQAKNQRIKS